MNIYKTIKDLRIRIGEEKIKKKTIGFVPTMGYLHEGHLSLIENARQENDIVVLSIFVNPTQFGEGEDFEIYPRDLDRDIEMAKQNGVDIIFAPEVRELYPNNYQTYVEVTNITKYLCGASRTGHFKGVTTIVNKLFNIIQPTRAYFGQKDAQQAIIIKRMVLDLNMNIEIIICPIIREEDGLAKSSRNVFLNNEEREQATILYKSLELAKNLINNGERDASTIKIKIEKNIKEKPLANIEYISIVDKATLEDINYIKREFIIALAVKFGNTRLIDNIMMEVE